MQKLFSNFSLLTAFSSLLAFCPEQLPDLQHQFFTVDMDTDGRCHGLCSKWNCNKWAQSFMQHPHSYVHPDKSSVWRDLHSVNYCTGQQVWQCTKSQHQYYHMWVSARVIFFYEKWMAGKSINIFYPFLAPCPPTVIAKDYTCGTSSAMFRWSAAAGNTGFLAQLAGEGYLNSCPTTKTSCAFQNLPCGLDLNLIVQAQGAECNSTQVVSEFLQTGNIWTITLDYPLKTSFA